MAFMEVQFLLAINNLTDLEIGEKQLRLYTKNQGFNINKFFFNAS